MSHTITSSTHGGSPALSDHPQGPRRVFSFLSNLGAKKASSSEGAPAARKWFHFLGPRKEAHAPSGRLRMNMQQQDFSAYRREIAHWQQARSLRYHHKCPLTYALQDVYMDTMLDAHLSAVIGNRVLRLQNKRYVLRNAKGELQPEKTTWLEKSWFQELIGHISASIFYGYSLIWIKAVDLRKKQLRLELVDRRHVVPERGLILEHMQDKEGGLRYADWPHELLYAQLGDPIGLLEKAAPLSILKRHSWANWDEFEQIFGLPIRVARVPNLETQDTYRIAQWLEEMGTAAYAVLPESAQVDIKESRRSDAYQVFQEKILCVNAEISKLINGQTMTVDSGSSRSQSEVHLRTESEVTRADIRNVLRWLNDHLLPALQAHGYEFDTDDRIEVWEEATASEKILIDKELLRAGLRLSPEYLSRTYGVVLAEEEDTQK